MEMNFCRRCGTPLTHKGGHAYACANGHQLYVNAAPTVGVFLIADDGQVLLARRGIDPGKGLLDTFGGFADGSESIETTAERELREELSLERNEYGDLHYIGSFESTYLFDGEYMPVLSTIFWTHLHTTRTLTPSDDVAEIVILPISAVDESQVHNTDIVHAVQALKTLESEGKLQ